MPLTLPGVLGRALSAAGDIWQSAKLAGQAYHHTLQFGDGRLYLGDGSEDMTASNLVYRLPDFYLHTKTGRLGMYVKGNSDQTIMNIIEFADYLGAPIMWLGNAGGLGLNDNFRVLYNPLAGAPNFFTDIYGHMQLGRQPCLRANQGPPGNILRWDDATGEVFQRDRAPRQGTWTAVNAAYGYHNYSFFEEAPTGLQNVREWAAAAAGNIVTTTAAGAAGYPVGSGAWFAATISTKSSTAARSKQLAVLCYNAAGTAIGSAITGPALTDTTTGWTRLDAQGVTPAGTVYCALRLTVTGAAAAGEKHQDTMAGLWPGLTTADLTAWNPPFIYRTDAYGGTSNDGIYDGANIGDVIIRNDGPGNIVQRFYTCVKGGRPWEQRWSADPRLTSQPAKINWYGGTHLTQGASASPDYILPNVVNGMAHNDPADSVNRGRPNARLMDDAAAAALNGGLATFVQAVRKKSTGQPYVAKDGVFVFCWGIWDIGYVTAAQGSAVMTRANQYSATPGTGGGAVVNTLRYCIRHARASVILPYTHGAFTLNGGANSGAVPYAFSGGGPAAPGTFRNFTVTSTGWTFTIPADFEGGAVSFALVGAQGTFGGTVTWGGTAPGASGTTNVSAVSDIGARNKVVRTFGGLTAADASKTITGTVTTLDSGGSVGLDCAMIEGPNPNLVFICGMPRLRDNTAYATLGAAMVASSYWAGNSGSTGDADVTALNTSLASLCGEFTDSLVQYVDLDGATQKYPNYYYTGDGVRFDESGVHAMAQQVVDQLNAALPMIDFRSVNHDFHDPTVVAVGTFTRQGTQAAAVGASRLYVDDYWQVTGVRAGVGTAPTGAALIIDVSKNGTTIFTTQANRPTIAISGFTVASAAPDVWALAPGDYLTVDVDQVGSTAAGSDLTVSVLGRKIPIP